MSYDVLKTLLILGAVLLTVGYVWRSIMHGRHVFTSGVTAAFVLLILFVFTVILCGSFESLGDAYSSSTDGILSVMKVPLVTEILDCGSLLKLFELQPLRALAGFMDVVLLSTIVELVCSLFEARWLKKLPFLTKVVIGFAIGVASMVLMKMISNLYGWITIVLGGMITILCLAALVISLVRHISFLGILGGMVGFLKPLTQLGVVRVFTGSLVKALLFLIGLLLVELFFSSFAAVTTSVVALVEVLVVTGVVLYGLFLIVRAGLR